MKAIRWANTIAYIFMLVINLLADLLPIGGRTTAQISAAYPTLLTPAGYTFAIWGVLYLMMGGFILYQWGVFKPKKETRLMTQNVGILFLITCMFNILWILSWHMDMLGLSLICILSLLITLYLIQGELEWDYPHFLTRVLVYGTFQLYYGWILIASLANLGCWLVKLQWDGFGLTPEFWVVVAILAGTGIGVRLVIWNENRVAGLGILWAYFGILVRHTSADGFHSAYPLIIAVTAVGILSILLSILWMTYWSPESHHMLSEEFK